MENNQKDKKENLISINFNAIKLDAQNVISLVLFGLIIISSIQTYQLIRIKSVGATTPSNIQSSSTAPNSQAPLPSSLENLPDMVGGC